MQLISNSVAPNTVETETINGDEHHIVKSVPFVRAQNLSGGYVPQKEIKASTEQWAGVALTANHPRDEQGEPVPANTKLNEVGVGTALNPEFDGEWVRADLRINADRARAMGGVAADIVAKIESGEKFDVSSQYVPRELPAGEYDGEHRANVEGIAQPDSIALLPHKPGQCSIEDGCGINPELVANSAVTVPMTHNADGEDMVDVSEGDRVEWDSSGGMATGVVREVRKDGDAFDNEIDGDVTVNPPAALIEVLDDDGEPSGTMVAHKINTDTLSVVSNAKHGMEDAAGVEYDGTKGGELDESEIPSEGFASHYVFPGETKSESSFPLVDADGNLRRGNVESAFALRGHADDESELLSVLRDVNEEFETPPIDSEDLEEAMSANAGPINRVLSFLGMSNGNSTRTMGAATDSGSESPADDDTSTTMEDKTAELVANHGFDADNLPSEDTDCFDRIYKAVTENSTEDNSDDSEIADTLSTIDERLSEVEESLAANSEGEETDPKEELAEEIVANSAEYEDTESVLEDYPTEAALETKKDSVTATEAAMPGAGAVANADLDFADEDFEDIPSGVIN